MNEITDEAWKPAHRAWGVERGMATALGLAAVVSLLWLLGMVYAIGAWSLSA